MMVEGMGADEFVQFKERGEESVEGISRVMRGIND